MTSTAPPRDKPVPFEAWTDDSQCKRDFERRCDTTSSAWQDSEGYSGEPVECELARSGRQRNKVSQHSDTDRHMHCRSANGRYDHQHHDHQHHLRADWNWTDRTTHDDRQQCVDYEQQLQKHGWRMEVHGDPLNIKKPCMAARPAYSQHTQPSPSKSPDSRRTLFQRRATFFNNVRPMPRSHGEFIIHPELSSELMCQQQDSLLSVPVRQCDIDAALIQRASQRRYVKNPFVY